MEIDKRSNLEHHVTLQIISKTMKSRYKLISMNLMNECLNNRSMNLQLRPSPTI